MSVQRLFLVGMPGCGKTHWGRRWAAVAGWRFIDLDSEIATQSGMTIPEFFRLHGEPSFREREQALLLQTIAGSETPLLLATGGGTPVFSDNLDRMKAAGCVVYLSASVDQLAVNVRREPDTRPLLASGGLRQRLADLLSQRQEVYEQAHLILPVESLADATFAQILTACTNRH